MENTKNITSGQKIKICPHCRLEVDNKASRCPHCHGKIYVWTLGRKLIAGIIGFFLVIGFIGAVLDDSGSTANTTVSQPPAPSILGAGSTGRLVSSSSGPVVGVAATGEDLIKISNLVDAQDQVGMLKMVDDGRVFMVNAGTSVKILATNGSHYQIQVLEGTYKTKTGWIPAKAITR